jgi:hypothetical protein
MILSVTSRFALDGLNVYILSPTTESLCPTDYVNRQKALIYTCFHIQVIVHSNAHKVIAGFFLSPDPEVT